MKLNHVVGRIRAGQHSENGQSFFVHKHLAKMLLLVTIVCIGAFVWTPAKAAPISDQYVCPPCGCGLDDKTYEKPGSCPVCGMELMIKGGKIPASAGQPQRQQKKAAILIFDGVQIIDYTGPYEIFGAAGLQVFTVATSTAPITTSMGMKVIPHYALDDAPAADVLLIPGGGIFATQQDPNVIKWIQERSKQTEIVMSVCNGALILAKTGLLDGLMATTTAGLMDGLTAISPKIKVVRDRRYVDNGKIITTAGLSSGIDGAFYVVSRLFGKGRAQLVALGEEYDWKGDSSYARANLADRHIFRAIGRGLALPVPEGAKAELQATEGTPQKWEMKWLVTGRPKTVDLLSLLNDKMTAAQWVEDKNSTSGLDSRVWKFTDQDGQTWVGKADADQYLSNIIAVTLRVHRSGDISATRTSAAVVNGADKLAVRDAWIQEMPTTSRVTAAHLIIENSTGKEDALIGARTSVAGAVELHRAEMDNGMMRMRKLDRIALPVGKTDLTGELHIMLIDLKAQLKEGDQVELTLEFQTGVNKTVIVPVKKRQSE